ncbi:hypothetical protein ACR784_22270 [Sphingobacterium multivorum]|uniref:Uncharacterized protein n=1 Tax=Sphingobacterium thalpophilum TaxID=259 RepID=A0ACD5BWT4_9SPHI
MQINKQEADTIVNIAGNLINSGELRINTVYLNVDGKQVEAFTQPDQSALKVQFNINYLTFLQKNFEGKNLIKRSACTEIEELLDTKQELAVIGQPGVGKSCMMYELSKSYVNVVYLNLKNKSLKTVLLYFINKINEVNSQPLTFIDDIDICLEILQSLLIKSKMIFFLDECEAAVDLFERILLLNKFENKFLYTSQNNLPFTNSRIEIFTLGTFDIEESRQYLNQQGLILDILTFNELYDVSCGNALYLYYYSQYSVNPLPKDLANYHRSIWGSLSNKEKECLIFISLSYLPMSITSLVSLVSFESLQEASEFISRLRLATISDDGHLSIFHPSFRDFISDELARFSTLKTYKIRLGEYYQEENDYIQATFLLIDEKPDAIHEFGFEALPGLVNRGDLELANRLINILLTKKQSPYVTGYLKYHLYGNLRLLNRARKADDILEEALKLLKKARDRKLYLSALMGKAIDLIERGEHQTGIDLADSILTDKSCSDELFKGQLLVSLSKIYVDLHQFKKAAVAAKTAYDSFAKENHLNGLISSLSNLASALGCTDDQKKLAEEYALKLLQLPLEKINYGTKLIVLNVLTSLNRQNRNYEAAKKYGYEAVYLCQHYKLEQKAILNLTNYGNVIRDTGDLTGAIAIYEEALEHSVKLDLPKEQSRVCWILSSIYAEQGEQTKSLEFIAVSIKMADRVNYLYGMAHGLDEQGALLSEMKRMSDAGASYEKAFHIFNSMDDMVRESRNCLTNAILCYMESEESDRLEGLINLSLDSLETSRFIDLGGISDYDRINIDVHNYFLRIGKKATESVNAPNLIQSYLNYLKYCKRTPLVSSKDFKNLLLQLSKNVNTNKYIKANLAVLIEQSSNLLNRKDLLDIIESLDQQLEGFFARETEFEIIFLISLKEGFNIEIGVLKDELTNIKLTINFILFLYSLPKCLCFKGNKMESFCKINMINYSTLISHLGNTKVPSFNFDDFIQVTILNRPDYTIPLFVVVNDDFESFSDLMEKEENKCNFYFIRTLINELIGHFHHAKKNIIWKYTKSLSQEIAHLYDYTMISGQAEIQSDFHVDLSKLDEAFNSTDYE